mmetsp:Transcript_16914/g.43255  ORF Transcript_16914/g.43255 Transcript_16914/m.43255 type:complete len:269 (+) Transcript_16914:186-992(+)
MKQQLAATHLGERKQRKWQVPARAERRLVDTNQVARCHEHTCRVADEPVVLEARVASTCAQLLQRRSKEGRCLRVGHHLAVRTECARQPRAPLQRAENLQLVVLRRGGRGGEPLRHERRGVNRADERARDRAGHAREEAAGESAKAIALCAAHRLEHQACEPCECALRDRLDGHRDSLPRAPHGPAHGERVRTTRRFAAAKPKLRHAIGERACHERRGERDARHRVGEQREAAVGRRAVAQRIIQATLEPEQELSRVAEHVGAAQQSG